VVHSKAVVFDWRRRRRECTRLIWHCARSSFCTELLIPENIDDVDVSSCLVNLAPWSFQPLRQQDNESLFVLLVREELFLCSWSVMLEVNCTVTPIMPRDLLIWAQSLVLGVSLYPSNTTIAFPYFLMTYAFYCSQIWSYVAPLVQGTDIHYLAVTEVGTIRVRDSPSKRRRRRPHCADGIKISN